MRAVKRDEVSRMRSHDEIRCASPVAAAADDVSPFSGVAAADEYQRRLAAFQSDASISSEAHSATLLVRPGRQGGGLGDVLGLVAREAAAALDHGVGTRRRTRSHRGATRRSRRRASCAPVADGWRCVFADAYAPLPADHPDRLHNQADEKFPARRCAATAPASPRTASPARRPTTALRRRRRRERGAHRRGAARGRRRAAAGAGVRLTELPDGAVEVAALVDPAPARRRVARRAMIRGVTPAPHVASYVAEKAAAAGVPPRDESGAPLPYVALHVRRGDACRRFGGCCWGNADGGGRHRFALEEYIELGATLATALNARHLLLATEDADEAARAPAPAARTASRLCSRPARRSATRRPRRLRRRRRRRLRADVFTRIEAAMDTGAVDAEGMILPPSPTCRGSPTPTASSEASRSSASGAPPRSRTQGARDSVRRHRRRPRARGAPSDTTRSGRRRADADAPPTPTAAKCAPTPPTPPAPRRRGDGEQHALDANRDGKLAARRTLFRLSPRCRAAPSCRRAARGCTTAWRTAPTSWSTPPWPAPLPEAAGAAAPAATPTTAVPAAWRTAASTTPPPCRASSRAGRDVGGGRRTRGGAARVVHRVEGVAACPHACGKCPRPQRRRRRGKPIHDPIREIVGYEALPRDDNPGSCDG